MAFSVVPPPPRSQSATEVATTMLHYLETWAQLFVVNVPPGDSLQPEATGAGMEETKCLKPSDSGSRIGDRASVQAATRVNAE
jgi:hypothetical protein